MQVQRTALTVCNNSMDSPTLHVCRHSVSPHTLFVDIRMGQNWSLCACHYVIYPSSNTKCQQKALQIRMTSCGRIEINLRCHVVADPKTSDSRQNLLTVDTHLPSQRFAQLKSISYMSEKRLLQSVYGNIFCKTANRTVRSRVRIPKVSLELT